MFIGIILIVAGLLIAVYPPLLSLIVATLVLLSGVWILITAYYHRKLARRADNPVVEFIFRY